MRAVTAWLLLTLAATPVDARFVLEVGELPVAELRVGTRGDTYFYEAVHFLQEGPQQRRIERSLREGTPEVLALLTPPALGCRDVVEERSAKKEALCVTRRDAALVEGTLAGAPFKARYARGRLAEITVGNAKWRATSTAAKPPPESPFAAGLAVPPGALRLTPAVDGARWLETSPRGIGDAASVGRTRCLLLAREAAARRAGARVVLGVVIENGRAFPHAWVAMGAEMLDPSVLADDEVLTQRRYLELPSRLAGATYLALFDGAARFEAR